MEARQYVCAVLEHLASVGFDGAPRLLDIDDRGRAVLEYIPGDVVVAAPAHLSDARLVSAARLVRGFHDATAGTPLAGDEEVVCRLGGHRRSARRMAARLRRARDAHAAAGRTKAVAVFEGMMEWMERNGPALKAAA